MEALFLDEIDACQVLKMGRTKLYGEIKRGRLEAVRDGKKRTRFTPEALRRYAEMVIAESRAAGHARNAVGRKDGDTAAKAAA
jgi:excisionase family DNA binding protein